MAKCIFRGRLDAFGPGFSKSGVQYWSGMDNPSAALSAFLMTCNMNPKTTIPLLGMLNGIVSTQGESFCNKVRYKVR